MVMTQANHSELTPLRFLQRSAEVYPSKTAIIHGSRNYSYAQFESRVQRFAQAIKTRINPGDRVAVLAPQYSRNADGALRGTTGRRRADRFKYATHRPRAALHHGSLRGEATFCRHRAVS